MGRMYRYLFTWHVYCSHNPAWKAQKKCWMTIITKRNKNISLSTKKIWLVSLNHPVIIPICKFGRAMTKSVGFVKINFRHNIQQFDCFLWNKRKHKTVVPYIYIYIYIYILITSLRNVYTYILNTVRVNPTFFFSFFLLYKNMIMEKEWNISYYILSLTHILT